jgi:hypothetical protein
LQGESEVSGAGANFGHALEVAPGPCAGQAGRTGSAACRGTTRRRFRPWRYWQTRRRSS